MRQLVIPECEKSIVVEHRIIQVINLTPIEANCVICWAPHYLEHWLPMYEDHIVDIDKTDEWAGQPVCPRCYEEYKDHIGDIRREVYGTNTKIR